MPRRTLVFLASLLATIALGPSAAHAACPDADLAPTATELGRIQVSTLCLLNEERAAHALPALTANDLLAQAGRVHARNMLAFSFFEHVGQDGSTFADRIRATGYLVAGSRWVIGENLAWGTGSYATPRAIVRAWMDSPGHRANILHSDYREIGIAVEEGAPSAPGPGGATYVTEFGRLDVAGDAAGDAIVLDAVETSTGRAAKPAAGTADRRGAATSAAARRTAARRTRCVTRRQKRTTACRALARRKAAAARRR